SIAPCGSWASRNSTPAPSWSPWTTSATDPPCRCGRTATARTRCSSPCCASRRSRSPGRGRLSGMSTPIIAPSILAADFARLARDIEAVSDADWIHIDVMDGHFVPTRSFGVPVMAAVAKVTDKPLDVHLMIEEPEKWVDGYVEAGAAGVTFHVEASEDPIALARKLREFGVHAGISV